MRRSNDLDINVELTARGFLHDRLLFVAINQFTVDMMNTRFVGTVVFILVPLPCQCFSCINLLIFFFQDVTNKVFGITSFTCEFENTTGSFNGSVNQIIFRRICLEFSVIENSLI